MNCQEPLSHFTCILSRLMPSSDELTPTYYTTMKCPTSTKTLEMLPVCSHHSISKMFIKHPSHKTTHPKVIINTELLKNVVLTASHGHSVEKKSSLDNVIYPVIERGEGIEICVEATEDRRKSSEVIQESDKENEEAVDLSKGAIEIEEDGNNNRSGKNFSHLELEPVRRSVFAVRRRSKQFFNSVTEETSETEDDSHSGNEEGLCKLPGFNLNRSLQNLYMSETELQQADDNTANDNEEKQENTQKESGLNLLSKVTSYKPLLRRIHSSPELHANLVDNINDDNDENDDDNFGLAPLSDSDSLAHLKRRVSQGNMNIQTSPGYAFLASVADSLRGKQNKAMSFRADMTVANIDKQVAKNNQNDKSSPGNISGNQNFKQSIEGAPAPSNIIKTEEMPKKSLMRSVYEWGTTSMQQVSNKEMNMYSPATF